MQAMPRTRTLVLSTKRAFADVEAAAWARAGANGWHVTVELVTVKGKQAARVRYTAPLANKKAAAGNGAAPVMLGAAAPITPGGPYVAQTPGQWLGKSVPNGQCVAYVKLVAGAPQTARWRRGNAVRRNSNLPSGTAIATFDPDGTYGNHVDGRSHAAIYISQDEHGLVVYDQWARQVVHQRTIRFGGNLPVNNGDEYYVIV